MELQDQTLLPEEAADIALLRAVIPEPPPNFLPPDHPWWQAVESDDIRQVRKLLTEGVNVDSVDVENNAALRKAAQRGYVEMLEVFAKCKPNLDRQNYGGKTAVMGACFNGQPAACQWLLKRGADHKVLDRYGYSCLEWAAMKGHIEIARMLLNEGADPNHQCHSIGPDGESLQPGGGATALIWAVHFGFQDMATLLLDSDADPLIRGTHGSSVLTEALSSGNKPDSAAMVVMLLRKGAQVPSSFMPDLLDWATDNHQIVLASQLLELVGYFERDGLSSVAAAFSSNMRLPRQTILAARRALLSYFTGIDHQHFARLAARVLLQPIKGLRTMISLSEEMRNRAEEVHTSDRFRADDYESLGVRLELACGAYLHTLSNEQINFLFDTPKGSDTLKRAVRSGCKLLIAQPKVQAYYYHKWYGGFVEELKSAKWEKKTLQGQSYVEHGYLNGASHSTRRAAYCALFFAQLPFLPLLVAYPPCAKPLSVMANRWCHKLRLLPPDADSGFLLELPFLKCVVAVLSDIGLATVCTVEHTHNMTSDARVVAILIWSAAVLWGKMCQFFQQSRAYAAQLVVPTQNFTEDALRSHRGTTPKGRVRDISLLTVFSFVYRFVRYMRSDFFYLVDFVTLVLTTIAYAISCAAERSDAIAVTTIAILLLWIRTIRPFVLLTSTGPLILMVVQMLYGACSGDGTIARPPARRSARRVPDTARTHGRCPQVARPLCDHDDCFRGRALRATRQREF
mmetsp:Transcript_33057/g.87223  ORF Transcript_33057/g.87223 Transcript_33057/m.87223 type:complete len:740 (+) Transcript_33057:93-2312(+)